MDAERAKEIVAPLADGVNPFTGEAISHDELYQNPDVARALCAAVLALDAALVRERKKRSLPENAGMPWSEDEDTRLLNGFDAGRPVSELARVHGRTRGAIEARLVMYDKLEPRVVRRG
ncbi:MAG: hypothetical protein ACR2RL_15380 [Gammaproteobacteria bacterium]